jgi:hypothetical protein
MLLTIGSVVLASVGLASQGLLARKHRAGWVAGLVAQVLAVPYDLVTRQFGFVALSAVAMGICVRGWRNWSQPDDTPPVRKDQAAEPPSLRQSRHPSSAPARR